MVKAVGLGLLVGFPIAVSPGPMFVVVFRRTLTRGWRSGLISGAGIASGDAIYAALAAFGVTTLINVLVSQRRWIGLAGGVAIGLIGLRTLLTNPLPVPPLRGEGDALRRRSLSTDYLSTLALTIGNPPTILAFVAIFAGLGVRVAPGWPSAVGLVIGVLLGSALWWLLLTGAVAVARARLSARVTRAIGVCAGAALIVLGLLISLQSL